jgi:hypothetical protein
LVVRQTAPDDEALRRERPSAVRRTRHEDLQALKLAEQKNLDPAAERTLAVLVLIGQNGRAPAGALATPGKP